MDCCVCLEEKNDFNKLNCDHQVCVGCYENLIKFDIISCPLCRTKFREKSNNKTNEEPHYIIFLEEIIVRRRRRNITLEEKLFNKQKAKKRIINSKNKKNKRLQKLTNCF
tara:strand:- start:64 stop:393 length:330 start_codon:yes stop_codon:yes gene_type:complete